ncbi:MAG: Lrp/AsnC family transcriptional regulator, partial [Pseudomonadota bacterium]
MKNKQLKNDLDEVDLTILQLLQEDGTLSNAKLAERLSLSVTPCWRRVRRLEEEGFIDGYQANLNRRKMGFGVLAFVQLGFESKLLSLKVIENLRQVKIPLYLSLAKDRLGAQVSVVEKYH